MKEHQQETHPVKASGPEGEQPLHVTATDCWNSRGVYGAGHCPELKKLVHCHNCSVFTSAARQFLDRPLPAHYREEWGAYFARPKLDRKFTSSSVISFRLGVEWLAWPTRSLQEISDRRPIHSLPHSRPFVCGVTNVRGELLTCISLAHLLRLEKMPTRAELLASCTRLLVVRGEHLRFCFLADEIRGPHRLTNEELQLLPPPEEINRGAMILGLLRSPPEEKMALLNPHLICALVEGTLK